MKERRQHPRKPVDGQFAGVHSTLSVQVLDISVSGVLLQAQRPVHIGERGSLRLSLGGVPLTADVEVQRVSGTAQGGVGYRVGVTFLAFTPEHAHLIERFISE
jgi:hypothetical protein